MENSNSARPMWRFFDGSVSVSISMLLSVALNYCAFCAGVPVLGFLRELTNREDGIIIVATLLLFPTTAMLYGGFKVFFAAKEAVENKARQRGPRGGPPRGGPRGGPPRRAAKRAAKKAARRAAKKAARRSAPASTKCWNSTA